MSNVLKNGELSVKIEKDRSKYWIGLFVVEVRGVEPNRNTTYISIYCKYLNHQYPRISHLLSCCKLLKELNQRYEEFFKLAKEE